MSKKNNQIFLNLLNLYKAMYNSKEIFNRNYFKYSIQEVHNAIELALSANDTPPRENKSQIRDSILMLKNEDDVKIFYKQNLQYDHSNKQSKEECLKNFSLNELKHLYSILYTTPNRKSVRKGELLDSIEKYFNAMDRAFSMKP
ncbi:MAG: hypothetical protein Q8920_16575 [Bacillota bacterium]|nr:hypothetical protein [Bacillota bacterium]